LGGGAVVASTIGAILTEGTLLPLIPIAGTAAAVGAGGGVAVGPIKCPYCGHCE